METKTNTKKVGNYNKAEVGEKIITNLLKFIGENPKREGLKDTPKRVVKMYSEIFKGYSKEHAPKITVMNNNSDNVSYKGMIKDCGTYWSHCEHHMVPFFGHYYFAYIPNPDGKILGLSKVARVVEYYSSKLQIQERLGSEIVEALWTALTTKEGVEPLGMAIVLRGTHLCKCMRGVKQRGIMETSELKGNFYNSETKMEFENYVMREVAKNER